MQLFIFCVVCERLTNDIGATSDALSQIDWFRYSPKFQMCIKLMLLRISKPQGITAGKFYIITLQSFGRVSII